MVLVTKERRRGGVGTGLLKRCIAEVQASGAVAGLDATEQGRPIYLPLGFRDLYRISRWHFDGAKDVAPSDGVAVRPIDAADLPAVLAYDRPLSGMERPALLAHLAARQPGWPGSRKSGGRLAGFVLGREGRMATSIGPVIADNEAIGLALIAKAAVIGAGTVHHRRA